VAKAASADAAIPSRRVRTLVTPEGVPLRWELGGAADRAAAFLIDAAIISAVLVGVVIVLIRPIMRATMGAGGSADEAGLTVFLLCAFALRNLYFAAWELTPRAATPGKRALKLRVAARDGGRLTAGAIFARNATRELEVFLPLSFLGAQTETVDAWTALLGLGWSALFLLFPLFNKDRLRAGDLLAGTWVVKAPRRRLLPDLAAERPWGAARPPFDFTPDQVDAYGVKELHVLETVLRTRNPPTLKEVAARIRTKIGWTAGPAEGDRDFLEAYYAALRRRLEGQLLFGRRRRDKHDRN
jgi:uncharacterized RDD family membrane protein YckC